MNLTAMLFLVLTGAGFVPRAPEPGPPLRVVLLIDFTMSVTRHEVMRPTASDLTHLIEVLRERGGELALGGVQEDAKAAFLRLRLEPPPPPTLPPECAEAPRNPFARRKAAKICREKQKAQKRKEAERRKKDAPRIERFMERAAAMLARAPRAKRTDVWSALRRAATFLEEPVAARGGEPVRWLVYVGDGEHNVRDVPAQPLPSDIRVLLVSGAAGMGVLEELSPRPLRFEAGSAAVEYILENARGNENE